MSEKCLSIEAEFEAAGVLHHKGEGAADEDWQQEVKVPRTGDEGEGATDGREDADEGEGATDGREDADEGEGACGRARGCGRR